MKTTKGDTAAVADRRRPPYRDTTVRDALVRNVCVRLHNDDRTEDEIRVVCDVLAGLERGAETHGPLDLEKDGRNWDEEMAQELRDAIAYRSMAVIARRHRAREAELARELRLRGHDEDDLAVPVEITIEIDDVFDHGGEG